MSLYFFLIFGPDIGYRIQLIAANGRFRVIEREEENGVLSQNVFAAGLTARLRACRGIEVAGQTFDRKVEGSSPDINIIGCRQEGHPDIKWLTAPAKVLLCRHRPTPNTGENGRKT